MKAYSLDLRQRVVDAYERGEGTLTELAALFRVSLFFIQQMLRLHRRGERLEPKPHGGGAPTALNDKQRAVLRAAVADRPDATLKELQEVLAHKGRVTVSEATLCRELQKMNLPRKKKRFAASERNEKKRRAFRRKAKIWDINQLLFVDEMGSNVSLARLYGRAEPGQRVVDTIPAARGENLSTIGALALDGVRAVMSIPGAVDGEVYQVFVQQVLAPRLRVGDIVFMDNVPTHKMVTIQEAITAVGARVEFLPPYSPDLSPIENLWSKVKAILRAIGARTMRGLMAALKKALGAVTPNDILGWFKHCGYQLSPN